MKLTDPAPPPELAAAFDDLVSLDPTAPDGSTAARTRRKVRAAPRRKPVAPGYAAAKTLALQLARYLGRQLTTPSAKAWLNDRANALNRGIIEAPYWAPLPPITSALYSSTPTTELNPDPAPYAYRDPEFLPSLATYPDGALATGNPRTAGARAAGIFADALLVWRHLTYQSAPLGANDAPPPLFVILAGPLQVTTDQRASRPMLSLLCRTAAGDEATMGALAITPPLSATTSHYWRYAIPPTAPPFFNAAIDRHILQPLKPTAAPYLAITAAPRPMLGYGFNNCESIDTVWQGAETLYAPAPCAAYADSPKLTNPTAGPWYAHNPSTAPGTAIDLSEPCAIVQVGAHYYAQPLPGWLQVPTYNPSTAIRIAADGDMPQVIPDAVGVPIFNLRPAPDTEHFTIVGQTVRINPVPLPEAPTDHNADSIYTTTLTAIDAAGNVACDPLSIAPRYLGAVTVTALKPAYSRTWYTLHPTAFSLIAHNEPQATGADAYSWTATQGAAAHAVLYPAYQATLATNPGDTVAPEIIYNHVVDTGQAYIHGVSYRLTRYNAGVVVQVVTWAATTAQAYYVNQGPEPLPIYIDSAPCGVISAPLTPTFNTFPSWDAMTFWVMASNKIKAGQTITTTNPLPFPVPFH